jgi:Flp pilus assembly protein TadG
VGDSDPKISDWGSKEMLGKFWDDRRGNYMLLTAAVMVPILGSLAVAVDYTVMSQQRQDVLNALDAAGVATARYIAKGASGTAATNYAVDFFQTNLNTVDPKNAALTVLLPADNAGGGTLKLSASMQYKPYFLPAFASLMGSDGGETDLAFSAVSEVQLKNTLEVALVLDNSGSMDYTGSGSGKKRMVLLKDAAKQLVDTLAAEGAQLKQITNPVQFAVVPFAASVNIGPSNKTESWMDLNGISPVHHENFDWTTMPSDRKVTATNGIYYKKGSGWGAAENQKVTRLTLYDDLQRITGTTQVQTGTTSTTTCTGSGSNKKCTTTTTPVYSTVPVYGSYASWQGCVEVRPYPYNVNDAAPTAATPATLYVPMFGPDETDNRDSSNRASENDWWADETTNTSNSYRQKYMPKYFTAAPNGTPAASVSTGPNASCTTTAITPLTDVVSSAGKTKVKAAIDAMASNGATNVPEGLAWGWRALSSIAPFTGGRPESEKGNDKVVIVLTDGANTYYTPSSLGYNDLSSNKSIYSAYGYAGKGYNGTTTGRIFMNTSVSKTDYSNGNYTNAMNEHFATLCTNAKAQGIMIMTVSLDLSTSNATEKAQIEALKACASDSRFRRDSANPTKPAKLYWNATGSSLAEKFKEIGEELSNLRIVG